MAFPALEPTSRTFTPGAPGQDVFTAASGIETRIIFGAVAVGHALELSFSNISGQEASEFEQHYLQMRGSFKWFALPVETFAGMSQPYLVTLNRWRYAGPPQIESVQPDVQSVSVSLIAVAG